MVHPTHIEYSVDHHYYGSNLPTILNHTYPMPCDYYILQCMYSSDESTSSMSDNDDKKPSNTSEIDQHNNKEVATSSTSEQSLNATYFLSLSTSDVEQNDVLSTETELSTSAITTWKFSRITY